MLFDNDTTEKLGERAVLYLKINHFELLNSLKLIFDFFLPNNADKHSNNSQEAFIKVAFWLGEYNANRRSVKESSQWYNVAMSCHSAAQMLSTDIYVETDDIKKSYEQYDHVKILNNLSSVISWVENASELQNAIAEYFLGFISLLYIPVFLLNNCVTGIIYTSGYCGVPADEDVGISYL